jgi:hypothetical protein
VKYEELGKGFIRKREKRTVGLFIDGTGLDRATRRINKKVDMTALLRGVTSGATPVVARYYTLIPYEDDSRQRSFLDAVARAGLSVIVKRLPPKGIARQVSVDLEMAADIVAFAMGHTSFSKENEYMAVDETGRGSGLPHGIELPKRSPRLAQNSDGASSEGSTRVETQSIQPETEAASSPELYSLVIVCPSRELAYPMSLVKDMGADTTTADFGQFNTGDILKSAAKWIDLSNSETIWRD